MVTDDGSELLRPISSGSRRRRTSIVCSLATEAMYFLSVGSNATNSEGDKGPPTPMEVDAASEQYGRGKRRKAIDTSSVVASTPSKQLCVKNSGRRRRDSIMPPQITQPSLNVDSCTPPVESTSAASSGDNSSSAMVISDSASNLQRLEDTGHSELDRAFVSSSSLEAITSKESISSEIEHLTDDLLALYRNENFSMPTESGLATIFETELPVKKSVEKTAPVRKIGHLAVRLPEIWFQETPAGVKENIRRKAKRAGYRPPTKKRLDYASRRVDATMAFIDDKAENIMEVPLLTSRTKKMTKEVVVEDYQRPYLTRRRHQKSETSTLDSSNDANTVIDAPS